MAAKKYVVRDGFVVHQQFQRADGSIYSRTTEAGEELTLDDDQLALHAHKVEFASEKDRAAALAAERQALAAARASADPADLIRQLTAALAQSQGTTIVAASTPSASAEN